ncbi:DUF1659 domain-containing protein [Mesotoga sp.]|uniref:DUF1659 domain-containing protein n=1 Tax=Mesotoga sp. TaxID=2053577 RepID=UPI00345F0021
MGLGSTVMVVGTEKSLSITWDTGVIEDDKPVLSRQTLSVDSAMTEQEAYDAAYNIAKASPITSSPTLDNRNPDPRTD